MSNKIRIGSRGSDLALWQAHYFQDQMKDLGIDTEIIIITTKGDRIQHLSFDKIEGKGFFTKEIEEALLREEIDIAIHSHKDLETQTPPGLTVAGVSYREDPSELLLVRKECLDMTRPLHFKENAVVGTSSARRKSQVIALRPDATIKDIRGNVPTRIDKLRSGDFDAILLAHAGVHRLGLDVSDMYSEKLDPRMFIPAPAQGVLAFQCREGDTETIAAVQKIHREDVANAIAIERGILSGFGGGCHIPIGVYALPHSAGYTVWASYGKDWNQLPSRIRFEADDVASALGTFTRKKELTMPSSVFISRSLEEGSYLRRAAAVHDFDLIDRSLITIHHQAFDADPSDFDWVIFSSSNGVHSFFEQETPSKWMDHSFATAGASTAAALASYGIEAAFIGGESDMSSVAAQLSEVIGSARALFPSSSRSLGSLQQDLPTLQTTTLTVYTTNERAVRLGKHEAYIFTSPSNVSAFAKAGNSIPPHAKVIAIGSSTGAALRSIGVDHLVASIPDEAELFALLAV